MDSKDLYIRLLSFVVPYRKIFALSIFATVILAATEPMLPALMKPLLDGSFVDKDPHSIKLMPLLLLGLVAFRGFVGYVSSLSMIWVSNKVVMDLRTVMFRKILSLPTSYFDDNPSGVTISRLTYDVNRVMSASTDVLVVLIRDSLAILGLVAWMFYLSWELSLVIFLIVPPTALIILIISRRLRAMGRSLQETMGSLTNVIQEVIIGNKVVKIFGGEDYEERRFNGINNWVRRYSMKFAAAAEINTPVVQFLSGLSLAIVVYLAALQSQAGQLTVGEFVSLFTAMGMMFSPLKRLTKINEKLQMGLAAAESIFRLLDYDSEQDHGSQVLLKPRGELEYRGLNFSYTAKTDLVLDSIDLHIGAGETIAFVGRSGSGKSTLVNLLPRFYHPSSGTIHFDGVDINDIKLSSLRNNIAYVGQDTVLFNDSVAANIGYGSDADYDLEKIKIAAEAAHAVEFIEQFPEGFDTLIGENGVRLSGGQRQRLAIARALYKNAPLLILDEATSSLDSQSERFIQAALENLRKGRTALIIAHRLATIENADRIVVMQDGKIVEVGSHSELMANGRIYAHLYQLQDGQIFKA